MSRYKLHNGDCIEVMSRMLENSVDAIVTDPPYELGFMGKKWDSTGIAFNTEVWKQALRVLKPGGHLLAFSGSRTYHRMAVAIEDAGFEIRDQIMWIYGSGFPKSLDVSKAIDKNEGIWRGRAGQVVSENGSMSGGNYERTPKEPPATDEAKQWQGWGTALKPAHEPIVLARKPLIGTVAANILEYGTGGLNIDGTRVEGKLEGNPNRFAKTDGGWAIAELHDAPVVRSEGRWPANVIHDGDQQVLDLFPNAKGGAYPAKRGKAVNTNFASGQETEGGFRAMGDDGSAARFFYCAKTSKRDRNEGLDDSFSKQVDESRKIGSKGGNNPRNRGANERINHHPTVKPTDLMAYLCRLVTQPDGIVLDPFMGSGSTGKAAMYEGFRFIGIEQSAEYLDIAKARIEFALENQ